MYTAYVIKGTHSTTFRNWLTTFKDLTALQELRCQMAQVPRLETQDQKQDCTSRQAQRSKVYSRNF